MPIRALLLILPLLFFLHACATSPDSSDEGKNWPASRLYKAGKDALKSGDYETAVKQFETLESRYPFGRFTQQAQLDVIYAYYKYDEPDSSVAAANRFIKLYPRHPNVDYAYYMRGLANSTKGASTFDNVLSLDPAERDPRPAQDAFRYFSEVVQRFPDSRYAQDAAQHIIFLRNSLARHELHAANYYLRRGAFVAAANRAKYVIENFPRTSSVNDALALMIDAYEKIGLMDLAKDAFRVLAINNPQHPALSKWRSRNPASAQTDGHL